MLVFILLHSDGQALVDDGLRMIFFQKKMLFFFSILLLLLVDLSMLLMILPLGVVGEGWIPTATIVNSCPRVTRVI